MSADYSLVDNYLKRSNLFYDACNNIAESIMEEQDSTYDMDRLDNDYPTNTDMMDAEYEDYINSYGMFKALKKWEEENDGMPPSARRLFDCIAWDLVVARVEGLIKNRKEQEEEEEEEKKKEMVKKATFESSLFMWSTVKELIEDDYPHRVKYYEESVEDGTIELEYREVTGRNPAWCYWFIRPSGDSKWMTVAYKNGSPMEMEWCEQLPEKYEDDCE
jgi:hypothetical protein